jgi:hypothetical protein
MNQRGPGGGGPGGGDGPQMVIMEGMNARYRLEFYAQISNLFNYVNYNTFIGNQLSPFYGQATSAGPARRIELGMSLGF